MEKYENLAVVGEGSYGKVLKCRHKETGQIVAIKKFMETEEDQAVRKMALREIRMLKKLRHENLVNMIEVFRRKHRFYLVFEYIDHTILDELEEHQGGLDEETTRQHIFQVVRGIDFCHDNNIVHRDIKPENVLVSKLGVIKLCDFGFARLLASPGETYTEYVATRWYRAPELLVGDTRYGSGIDIWAIGCLFAEMMTGDPLFPGDSDIDQLFQIVKLLGKLPHRHQILVSRNPLFKGMKSSNEVGSRTLLKMFSNWSPFCLDFINQCLKLEPNIRPTASKLLEHSMFVHDGFPERFLPELRERIFQEFKGNPLLKKYQSTIMNNLNNTVHDGIETIPRHLPSSRGPRSLTSFSQGSRWSIRLKSEKLAPEEIKRFESSEKDLIHGSSDARTATETTEESKENENTQSSSIISSSSDAHEKVSEITPKLQSSSDTLTSSKFVSEFQIVPPNSQFQSLQLNFGSTQTSYPEIISGRSTSEDTVKCLQNLIQPSHVLHPNINNINLNLREPISRSNILRTSKIQKHPQLLPACRLRELTGRPLLEADSTTAIPPKTHLIRRIDKGLKLDVTQLDKIPGMKDTSPLFECDNDVNDKWLSKWKLTKLNHNPHGNFSLPNVPGVTFVPGKSYKKKLHPMFKPPSALDSQKLSSPRKPSSEHSSSPKLKIGSNLPLV